MRYYVALLLNCELVSTGRVKLCLVSVFSYIVKDCPKMRNLPKIFLRSFKNVGPVLMLYSFIADREIHISDWVCSCAQAGIYCRLLTTVALFIMKLHDIWTSIAWIVSKSLVSCVNNLSERPLLLPLSNSNSSS